MCGFVALLSPALPIHESLLGTMRDRLFHRGPDNGASWIHPRRRIALAHRRLSIIDTSHSADQPMRSTDRALTLVFNGEIYNYVELREELVREGFGFHTHSDTEVLLAAYQHWGDGCLTRLNGMFAFAVWNERTQRLFIARDRFGEKPLFLGRGRFGVVAFASEIKAILAHPQFAVQARVEALRRYSRGMWYENDELTFFEGIERLPPSHGAEFSADGTELRRWRYWTPNYEAIDHDIMPLDAVRGFRERLEQAIKLRLRADVPIGSSLSGGLDSSTIVGMLALERQADQFTQNVFSACFSEDPTISEHCEVDEVVRFCGVRSFRVNPSAQRLAEESLRLHWHQEEPFLSASIFLQWSVARLAREQNTTVLLDGQGADELLAGYQFYFKLFQLDLLDRGLLTEALAQTALFTSRLLKASVRFSDSERRFNSNVAYTADELRSMVDSSPNVWDRSYQTASELRPGGRLRRTLAEALQYNSLPMLLRYADRNAMAFSRETRFPFLDYELVDYCIALPDEILVREGWQKWVLREAAAGIIPETIRWRADKVGYAAPLDLWLRGELKEWAQERVFDRRLVSVEGYDNATILSLWNEHQAEQANHSWAIWRWISLTEWFELLDRGWWRAGAPELLMTG